MTSDPGFDPIFNTAPARRSDEAEPERGLLFDGWSFKPLAAEHREHVKAGADRHR